MTCPSCGAPVAAGDRFCTRCGCDTAAGANTAPSAEPDAPAHVPGTFRSADTSARPQWPSGSSIPPPNPYPGSRGPVPRPPWGANRGGGLLQGIGAAVVALGVILAKFGGAVAGLGIFKLLGIYYLAGALLHGGVGSIAVLLLIVFLVGLAIHSWHAPRGW